MIKSIIQFILIILIVMTMNYKKDNKINCSLEAYTISIIIYVVIIMLLFR
jgi:heme/copper-type cytochrome/quinol oxidase subunit 4